MSDLAYGQPQSSGMASRPLTMHPIFICSIVVLFLNDQVFKDAFPSWWTGKLSDTAGLVLAPLFVVGLYQSVKGRDPSRRSVLISAVLIAVSFTLVKVFPWGEASYEVGLAGLQWPFRVAMAFVRGHAVPSIERVDVVRDVTDLLALPFAFLVLLVARSSRDKDF